MEIVADQTKPGQKNAIAKSAALSISKFIVSIPLQSLCRRLFDDADFGVGQTVELVNELVDLPVGGKALGVELGIGCRFKCHASACWREEWSAR